MEGPEHQPDELGALKEVVGEFVNRLKVIEGEIDLLTEQKKDLVEEFKEKLDMKTLTAAMRTVKIKKKVKYKDTYDVFVEIVSDFESV